MSEKSFLARNWKILLNVLTIGALLVLIYAIRHQLADTIANLSRVNVYVLLLMVVLEAINYHAQVKIYQDMFRLAGTELAYKPLLKVAIELNFVNHVFPSGGVSGISYFGLRMKSLGVRGSRSTLVQTMKLVLTFLSFEVIIFIGMLLLALNGKASNLIIFIGTTLAVSVLALSAGFVYIIGSRARINGFFGWLALVLNRLIQVVRPHHPETISIEKARESFDDFHDTYLELSGKWKELWAPFWWGFVFNITEVLVIYVVYIAFGEWVNFGALVLAYAVANIAGMISVLPGGVGIYEGLMTIVLATAGIKPSVSLPVTVMYRVINTIIQIPPGYVLYHRAVNTGRINRKQLEEAVHEHDEPEV